MPEASNVLSHCWVILKPWWHDIYIIQQGEEKCVPQSSYKKRVDDTTCKVYIKTFNSIETKNTQSSARLKQNVKIVSKNVQILQASIAFTYIVLCAKEVNINVHFVMMKSLLKDNYKKCQCHFERCSLRKCLKCKKVFSTKQELKAHGLKKHPKYSCTRCMAFFESERQLEDHKERKKIK